jgi:hypothetical protein
LVIRAGGPPLRLDRAEPSTLLIVDGRSYLIERTGALMAHMTRSTSARKTPANSPRKPMSCSLVLYHYNSAKDVAEVKKYFTGPVFGSVDLASYCLDARAGLHACASQ